MTYTKFFAMIATSTVVMFILMYLNTYLWGHVFFSETRVYMAVLMGATMGFVMMAFMMAMYPSKLANGAILLGSVILFALSLWLVRSQVTVQDRSYMRAMIPHHSIAIMTSTRAKITDPRVQTLADDIIYAQDKEIAEMRFLIADISENGEAAPSEPASEPQLLDAERVLATEVLGKIDPEFMTDDDIAKVFPEGAACTFTYTTASPPVLAVGDDEAVLKISGDLVRLDMQSDDSETTSLSADPLTVEIRKGDDMQDMIVALSDLAYHAGFRGQYSCGGG